MKIVLDFVKLTVKREYNVPFNIGDIVKITNAGRVLSKYSVKRIFGVKEYDGKLDERYGIFPMHEDLYKTAWKVASIKSSILPCDIQILLTNRYGYNVVMEHSLDSDSQVIEVIRNGKPKEIITELTITKQ